MPIEVAADLAATEYVTSAQVDTIARRHVRGSAWLDLEPDEKNIIRATATRMIDVSDWIGSRATDEQALEWPRTDASPYSATGWPSDLVNAVAAFCIWMADNHVLDEDATVNPVNPDLDRARIKRKKTGPLETEYFAPGDSKENLSSESVDRFPPEVANYLRRLVRAPIVAGYGTGRAARGS